MESNIVLKAESLSKWYGNILGISEISLEIAPGVQGLLGPNGAGKSTFLKIATGQLKQNLGQMTLFGEPVYNNHRLFSRVGFCPEYDCYYKDVTGWEFILFLAKLHCVDAKEAADMAASALERVGMRENENKLISAYSLGMRQRLKVAASIVHNPDLLVLDEPLRAVDPLWRVKIIKLIKQFEKEGKTVIVSSHILPEIEAMTNNITLIHQGKIFAHGDIQEVRSLIDTHPHQVSIVCDNPRLLAEKLIRSDYVLNVHFNNNGNNVVIETNNRDSFFDSLLKIILETGLEIEEMTSPDDNLQAVFDYLIGK
ncbi:MAG: ABC transporter ATP-binding protein [Candidatus Aminicenantes bacterium]|nr:ABC transporter ATP-binding protein [Candidatus Aminicenantes bacterium]